MLSCEGVVVQGPQAICEKYSSLGPLRHHVVTKDVISSLYFIDSVCNDVSSPQVQYSLNTDSLLILVTGQLIMGDNKNPLMFCQVLFLP